MLELVFRVGHGANSLVDEVRSPERYGDSRKVLPTYRRWPSLSRLTERLAGAEDGQQKVFRDSAVENLTEFFDRFRHLSLSSNSQLDELVDQAQRVVRGVGPQQLRDDQTLRQHVATELSAVQSVLDGLLIDRPRRRIIRSSK